MINLYNKILELKQSVSGISTNPVLDLIELSDCQQLDSLAKSDAFVSKKIKEIIKLSENLKLDFDSKYKSIYDNYSEATLYAFLRQKNNIEAIPEGITKTPDFKILIDNEEVKLS
ncbi:MAG: hypothetical protein IPH16_14430 [Haliscomenobacter sp.]|nr:hypothetical protein [Haliscomenobacter sp.]